MGGFYILIGSILEKCGKFWKNGSFSGRIWPDWGNTARADLAGLGSIGLKVLALRKIGGMPTLTRWGIIQNLGANISLHVLVQHSN